MELKLIDYGCFYFGKSMINLVAPIKNPDDLLAQFDVARELTQVLENHKLSFSKTASKTNNEGRAFVRSIFKNESKLVLNLNIAREIGIKKPKLKKYKKSNGVYQLTEVDTKEPDDELMLTKSLKLVRIATIRIGSSKLNILYPKYRIRSGTELLWHFKYLRETFSLIKDTVQYIIDKAADKNNIGTMLAANQLKISYIDQTRVAFNLNLAFAFNIKLEELIPYLDAVYIKRNIQYIISSGHELDELIKLADKELLWKKFDLFYGMYGMEKFIELFHKADDNSGLPDQSARLQTGIFTKLIESKNESPLKAARIYDIQYVSLHLKEFAKLGIDKNGDFLRSLPHKEFLFNCNSLINFKKLNKYGYQASWLLDQYKSIFYLKRDKNRLIRAGVKKSEINELEKLILSPFDDEMQNNFVQFRHRIKD